MRDFMAITKALADENRVRMLLALRDRELCEIVMQLHPARSVGPARPGTVHLPDVRNSLRPKTPATNRRRRSVTHGDDQRMSTSSATSDRLKVLFLCTGNSCRSQMAEGWTRQLKGNLIEAYSAGIETHGLNPQAVTVMAEAGVDISGHRSKHVRELSDIVFDYAITVCGNAQESCPVFPGRTKVVHVGFDDPPQLAKEARTEAEALNHYRRVRDEIRKFVEALPAWLTTAGLG